MPRPARVSGDIVIGGDDRPISSPKTCVLGTGNLVSVWTAGDGGSGYDLFIRIATPAGSAVDLPGVAVGLGSESIAMFSVAALEDGRFVVTWIDEDLSGGDSVNMSVRQAVFEADGSPVGAAVTLASSPSHQFSWTDTSLLPDGRFMTVWADQGGDDNNHVGTIKARIFTEDGVADSAVLTLATSSQLRPPEITSLSNGKIALVWGYESAGFAVQFVNQDGTASGALRHFVTSSASWGGYPSIAALKNGNVVVAWQEASTSGPDRNDGSLHAQILNGAGVPVGVQFVLNSTFAGHQHGISLGALPDGRFVAVWSSLDRVNSETTIFGRIFTADGSPSSVEFVVAPANSGDVRSPELEVFSDGRFAVSWLDGVGHMAIFDSRTAAVSLAGDSGANSLFGSQFNDTINGLDGADSLYGSLGADSIKGGTGDDVLDGGDGNDSLLGEAGNDTLLGQNGNDHLRGGAGADLLVGGGGNDVLSGGTEKDVLRGGEGQDRFVFRSAADAGTGAARDIITDFTHLGDDIDLSAFMAGGSFVGGARFTAALQVRYDIATGLLSGDVDGDHRPDWQITLKGNPVLTAADFLF